jgi:hypothetical protein
VSLAVDLAVLADVAVPDSRGNLTLVGVNPQVLIAEEYPVQFAPFLLVMLKDDDGSETLLPGRIVNATVEATGPDGEVLFVFPLTHQPIAPPPFPALKPRVQVVGQVPFTASKPGDYTVSARIKITADGETIAEVSVGRTVRISDLASLKPKTN